MTETSKNGAETISSPKTHVLQGKELAELLDVAPASLCQAAKKEHQCGGYDVGKWADRDENGKLVGYQVPEDIYKTLSEDLDIRENPEDENEGKTEDKPIQARKKEQHDLVSGNSIPILPPNQNYAEPVAAYWIGKLGYGAISNDTPNARAIVLTTSASIGSFMGYKFSDHWPGALIGAALGFGVAYWGQNKSISTQNEAAKSENLASLMGANIKPKTYPINLN